MTFRILIADDDADNRTIMKEAFEAAGLCVLTAAHGEEALEIATREKPDALLLDLSMPRMNGWDVAKRLRETDGFASFPIIAFTAYALAGEEARAKAAGCSDYITKPCVPKEVVERVRHWLSSQEAGRG